MSEAEASRTVSLASDAAPHRLDAVGWRLAILLLVATLPFVPALAGPFVYDDAHLLGAPYVVDPLGLPRIWASGEPDDYWPVSYTLFWLEWRLFSGCPPAYHAVSILLHAACCLMLWRLLAMLRVACAWESAMLFATHPVTVGAVAFAAQQKTLLAALLGLACLACHAAWMDGGRPRGLRWAITLCAAAMLAKTTAVAIPPVLVLLTRYRAGRWWDRRQLATAPYFGLAAACGGLAMIFKGAHAQHTMAADGMWFAGLAAAAEACWFYLSKAVWPFPLLFLYPPFESDPSELVTTLAIVGLTAGIAAALVMRSPAGLAVSTCLLVYLASLGPAVYFKAFLRFWQFHVADYYQYPGLAAVMVLVTAGFRTLAERIPACRWAGPVAIMLLAAATFAQAHLYRDPEVLYAHSLRYGPRSAVAANNCGRVKLDRGEVPEAISLFARSLELAPANRDAVNNLVEALLRIDRPAEARAAVRRFVSLLGEDADTLTWEGATVARTDPAAAEALFRRALAIDSRHVHALVNLGNALARQARRDEAIAEYRRALALDPENRAARENMGRLTATGH